MKYLDALKVFLTVFFLLSFGNIRAQEQSPTIDDFYRVSPAWSPDNNYVATANEVEVFVWDVKTNQVLLTLSGFTHGVTEIAWSPDQQSIAIGDRGGSITIWQSSRGELLQTLQGQDGNLPVTALIWSPDEKWLVSGSDPDGGSGIYIWDVQSGQLFSQLAGSAPALAFSADGRYIASGGSRVRVWDSNTLDEVAQFFNPDDTNNFVTTIAWSPDNDRIVTGAMNGAVYTWDISAKRQLLFFEGSPAYERISSSRSSIRIPYEQLAQTWIRDVAFSPDGQQTMSAAADGTVQIWDIASESQIYSTLLAPLGGATWSAFGIQLAYLLPSNELNGNIQSAGQENELHITIPFPSIEQFNTLAQICNIPDTVRLLDNNAIPSEQVDTVIAEIEGLPENSIPLGCTANIIAVAEALQNSTPIATAEPTIEVTADVLPEVTAEPIGQ